MSPNYKQLYQISENQGGYFTSAQAKEAGFSYERLSSNAKSGKFLRARHGIYRLALFPNLPNEDLFVAWLRTAPNSVISHESALSLYELSDIIPNEIHVIVPRTSSRRRSGIRQHTNQLQTEEITRREGLPVTTVARTIADVASSGLSEEHIRQAITEALQRGLATRKELVIQAKHRGGRMREIIRRYFQEEILS